MVDIVMFLHVILEHIFSPELLVTDRTAESIRVKMNGLSVTNEMGLTRERLQTLGAMVHRRQGSTFLRFPEFSRFLRFLHDFILRRRLRDGGLFDVVVHDGDVEGVFLFRRRLRDCGLFDVVGSDGDVEGFVVMFVTKVGHVTLQIADAVEDLGACGALGVGTKIFSKA